MPALLGVVLQAYGMMGWRVGYLAFPEDGTGSLAAELVKVQDTVRQQGRGRRGRVLALCGCGGGG